MTCAPDQLRWGGNRSRDLHVMPAFWREKKHDASPECWCEPTVEYVGRTSKLWLHRRTQ